MMIKSIGIRLVMSFNAIKDVLEFVETFVWYFPWYASHGIVQSAGAMHHNGACEASVTGDNLSAEFSVLSQCVMQVPACANSRSNASQWSIEAQRSAATELVKPNAECLILKSVAGSSSYGQRFSLVQSPSSTTLSQDYSSLLVRKVEWDTVRPTCSTVHSRLRFVSFN
ncbi:hypothetical protein AKJ16_DCAP21853 [Drosera capensis]